MTMLYLTIAGAFAWAIVLLLPWRPWATSEVLDADVDSVDEDLNEITVLIPARNESELIQTTLKGVRTQAPDISVVVVDDQSTDGTAGAAETAGLSRLQIVSGTPSPEGWSGKLWALEQGLGHVSTPWVLLLDADIQLEPGVLSALVRKMREGDLDLVSLMATLRMGGFWERAFMPAFVYFFKMLYPFRLSNARVSRVAAAAGGCILLRVAALRASGGFRALRHELIDDCALARQIKGAGGWTWIGLSHSVKSLRPYEDLRDIWDMVARTAFHQLRYSVGLLSLCTLLMTWVFWVPAAGLMSGSMAAGLLSAGALMAMAASYLPVLRFYGRSVWWALALPFIATGYLAMTWSSAIRFWQGRGATWKGRSYGSHSTRDRPWGR